MSNRYLMGIDNGGTSTKAAIYDMEGHEIKKTTTNTKMLTPRPFFTERDMEELHKANIYVIKKTINDSMVNPHNIVGIAVTGHGNGMYMSDEHGKATHNGIISTDTRAERYVQKWLKDPAYDTVVRPKTMQNVWASQPPALMAWLQDHEPEVLERTKYVFMVPDMVRFWLTGVARTEITNMSGTSLMNLKTKEFDPELFKFFGIEKWLDKLPPIAKSTEQCGAITQPRRMKQDWLQVHRSLAVFSTLQLRPCQLVWFIVTSWVLLLAHGQSTNILLTIQLWSKICL